MSDFQSQTSDLILLTSGNTIKKMKGMNFKMNQFFSLIKAAMSQDMNLFKVKPKSESKVSKIIFPIFLAIVLMFCIGGYAYSIAELLTPMGLIDVLLSVFIILTAILTIFEGAYKSQGILFESKDSDLLFSLPITKKRIFLIRVLKLMVFQLLYNSLFLIPSVVVYGIYQKVNLNFCIFSFLMIVLSPIIPTIIGCFIGYIIKGISSKFKVKKSAQVILSSTLLLFVLYISLNKEKIFEYIAQNAGNIDVLVKKIYYPAVLFSSLIKSFNVIDFCILIAINIIPVVLFIYLGSIFYFKISSKSTEKGISRKNVIKNNKYNVKTPLKALIYKELKRFFTSPVFIINSAFGLLLMVVATIGLVVNLEGLVEAFSNGMESEIQIDTVIQIIPKIYFCLVVILSFMTSITSSMISLEGKNIDITKSLPVSSKKILLAKILTSNIISVPVILVCNIIFFASFKIKILDMLLITLASIIFPTFSAILGLIINLKHPKLDANSDAEVIKQSMSSFIAVFSGMLLGLTTSGISLIDGKNNTIMLIEILLYGMLDILLWLYIVKIGTKKFEKLNV